MDDDEEVRLASLLDAVCPGLNTLWAVCFWQFKLDLGELDITTDEVNFDEIDDDLGRFQQDEIVKEALEKVAEEGGPLDSTACFVVASFEIVRPDGSALTFFVGKCLL